MTRLAHLVVRWGSTLASLYLGLFFWLDAGARFTLGRIPPVITWPVVAVTLILALRLVRFHERRDWALTLSTLSGLLVDWKPWLLGVLLLAGIALFSVRWHRKPHATILGRRLVVPWPVQLTVDERFLHLHVLGPTGSGKSSSVLMPLLAQDLREDHALILMEPKGDLAAEAYRQALHEERSVIWFDPLSPTCPHYNPLAGPEDIAAEGLAWALNQISEGGHPYYAVAARIQLLYAVRAIKNAYGETADLGSLLAFLRDEAGQKRLVRDSQDEALIQYFEEQWSRRSGASREDRQGLLNRLELLFANPAVRRVLSSPNDFTWDEVLRDRWVVLCPLSLAQLGESARALGSLLWHGLAQAAYRRNPAAPNAPAFLYLDEFHQWISEDLSDFLALARGYSMGLILAHQDMGQLSPALQEAVIANARQRIILSGSAADDIARFQRAAEPFPIKKPVRYLRRGHAMMQLTQHGRLTPPHIVRLAYHPLSEVHHGA